MNDVECNALVKVAGFVSATAICIAALMVDGITAITLSIAVAASVAGVSGYASGALRTKRLMRS